jgi:hypothetical protein
MVADHQLERDRSVTRQSYGPDAIALIAAELGVEVGLAPFQAHGETVWQCRIPARWCPGVQLHVLLWPSHSRVDVRVVPPGGGQAPIAFTAKGVHSVEIYHGVEVMFRRDGGSVLFITRHGHVAIAD